MNVFRIILISFLLKAMSANATGYDPLQVWYSSSNKDEFTNEITYSAYGQAGSDYKLSSRKTTFMSRSGYSFGVRCDISKSGNKDFMLTFSVDNAIATPNSSVAVFVKVDENDPISLSGKLYSNSYESGFVRLTSGNKSLLEKLVSQGVAGSKMSVRIQDSRKSSIENYSVLLRGFTKHTKEALKACGVSGREEEMKGSDKKRLIEIESKIKELEQEKKNILSKY